MFLDASVILAVLLREAEALAVMDAAGEAADIVSSPLAVFEASSRLVRQGASFAEAHETVASFLAQVNARLIPIGPAEMQAAHACAARYHHLTGHPARLNMGDCFAYACAMTSRAKLAYKGDDFVQTDADGLRFGG